MKRNVVLVDYYQQHRGRRGGYVAKLSDGRVLFHDSPVEIQRGLQRAGVLLYGWNFDLPKRKVTV
jgi:hypothetical protein